ncbi:MAG: nucleoside monophosphate kinase [Proteobacteria bacterium]|nr:nucleoside monophosphate kinase [Pseudomonadota bacterium]
MIRLILLGLLLWVSLMVTPTNAFEKDDFELVVLFGRPGAGKGTIAQSLKEDSYLHISLGDIFRSELKRRTPIGVQYKEQIESACGFLPDDVVIPVVNSFLENAMRQSQKLVLDGFPRMITQFKALEEVLHSWNRMIKTRFIYIEVDPIIAEQRILNRLVCTECSLVYSRLSDEVRDQETCVECMGQLMPRAGDVLGSIPRRFKAFEDNVLHVIRLMEGEAVPNFYKVNGNLPSSEVLKEIRKILALEPVHKLSLKSQIVELSTFKEVKKVLNQVPSGSLIVTDIDNVLIYHRDKVLRPASKAIYRKLMDKLKDDFKDQMKKIGNKEIPFFEYLHGLLIRDIRIEILDEESPQLFERLRNQGQAVLALSAGKTGPYAEFESMEDLRVERLKALGFNFSSSFPGYVPTILEVPFTSSPPIFKEGVILTGKASKALCLESFLSRLQKSWMMLVYIDDRKDWVEEVYRHFSSRMPVLAIHYVNKKFLTENTDEELAKRQFDLLCSEHRWLSDEEVKSENS